MIGVRLDDALQHGADDGGLRLRRSILPPVIPRHGVHHRVRIQRQHVGIIGMGGRHLRHGVGVSAVKRRPGRRGILGEPVGQRLDQRALAGAGAESNAAGGLHGPERRPPVLGRHRRIEIRRQRQRDSPVRHRQAGIESRSLAEGASRLLVVERIQQPKTLVEEGLRAGVLGGDGHVDRAEAGERRAPGARLTAPAATPPVASAKATRPAAAATRQCRPFVWCWCHPLLLSSAFVTLRTGDCERVAGLLCRGLDGRKPLTEDAVAREGVTSDQRVERGSTRRYISTC